MNIEKKGFRKVLSDLSDKYGYLFTAFLIPVLLMWMIYIALEVWPFGNNSVLVLDLNGQYVYFFEDLKNKVLNGGSLLYTWSRDLGGEFMGIFAYYLSSPFSFLMALFSSNHTTEALLLIILLKSGTMGATMAYYLNESHPTKRLNTIIFSTCYALSGYAVVMANNTMWFDCLIYLPLVTLGIERLIKKHDFKLFVVSLAMSLLTSFYIGYMVCLYVMLYFFYYYVAHMDREENNFWLESNHFFKSLGRIILYSAIAICIAMIIIYPAYTSLQFGKNEFSEPTYEFTQNFEWLDFFVKLFPGSYDSVRPEGLPFVYCGTIAPILLPIYFLCSRIRWQERMASGLLLAFFLISFNTSAIDIVWHGFQKPNWLNYRYAFIFVFLMLTMAYKAFGYLKDVCYKNVVIVTGIFVLLVNVIQKQDYAFIDDMKMVWTSLLCLAVFCVALYFVHHKKYRERGTAVVAILVCIELFTAGLFNAMALDDDVIMSTRDSYNDFISDVQPLVDYVKANDTSEFYRMEKNFHRQNNGRMGDSMALGYYGISCSTSTLNKATIELLHRFGYTSRSHWSLYLGGTPTADALLGIKYVLSNKAVNNDVWKQLFHDPEKNYYVYENPYALSLAYAVDEAVLDYELTDHHSTFEVLNSLVSAMTESGEGEEIFRKLTLVSTDYNNVSTGFVSQHYRYGKRDSSQTAEIVYTVSVKGGEPVYIYVPTDYPRECELYLNGVRMGTYLGNKSDCVQYLGIFDSDQDITVSIRLKDDDIYVRNNEHYFFSLNTDQFKETFNSLKEGNLNITLFEEDYIEGTVYMPEGKELLFTTIPFDEGWIVTVDGEETDLIKVCDSLIAIEVPQGEHEITFTYRPTCYTVGSAVSIFGLVAFGGLIGFDEWKKRRDKRRWAQSNALS